MKHEPIAMAALPVKKVSKTLSCGRRKEYHYARLSGVKKGRYRPRKGNYVCFWDSASPVVVCSSQYWADYFSAVGGRCFDALPGWARNDIEACLLKAKRRSLKNGRDVTISSEDMALAYLRQDGRCALSNIPFAPRLGRRDSEPYRLSIDRIDSSRGYTPENTRLVLVAVNYALNSWGDDTLISICRAIVAVADGNRESPFWQPLKKTQ